jgi:hypothetical protein
VSRSVFIAQPGIQGRITDLAPYMLALDASADAQDAVAPAGRLTRRRGWPYDGTTADSANANRSVWRVPYVLADVTRTITTDSAGNVYIHNPAAAGTSVGSPGVVMRAACQYRDQTVLCASDGVTPLRLYSGASLDVTESANVISLVAGQAIATLGAGSFDASSVGGYLTVGALAASADQKPFVFPRVLERNSSTSVTLEGIRASAGGTNTAAQSQLGLGYAFPAVNVYSAGTVTLSAAGNTATGVGTRWVNGGWGAVGDTTTNGDSILIFPGAGSDLILHPVGLVSSDTSLSVTNTSHSDANVPYAILRRCPFTDAEAHAGSLWGSGVAQFPGRLYFSPKGWNPTLPPGAVEPFDPIDDGVYHTPDPLSFMLDFVDIPAVYDGDPIVAIQSTSAGLLVLKNNSSYLVAGEAPNIAPPQLLQAGIGCIDVNSAISVEGVTYWASRHGVHAFDGKSAPIDLTKGRIKHEWQNLVADGVSYCAAGVGAGHLVVTTVTTNDAATYVWDLSTGAQLSTLTNVKARCFFPSRAGGEVEKLLFVSDLHQGRVMDLVPALNLTGTEADGDGTHPTFRYLSPSNLAQYDGVDGESRMLDVQITANVYDTGAAGSTQLTPSVTTGGGLRAPADATKTLEVMRSDAVDRQDRFRRAVNRSGRYHQLEIEETARTAMQEKVEIGEIAMRFRDARRRS